MPKLSSLKQHVLSHTVSEVVESQSGSAGRFWLRVSQEAAVELSPGAALISRLDWSWRICFGAHSCIHWPQFLPGGCLKASVPHHVGLSTGLLPTWLPPEWVIQEVRESSQESSHSVSNNVTGEVTYHCYCHMLLVTQTNSEGGTTRVWIQEMGISGGRPGGGPLPVPDGKWR